MPKKQKQKKDKTLVNSPILFNILALTLLISLCLAMGTILRWWSIPLYFLVAFIVFVYISYRRDKTIPGLGGDWLHREYEKARREVARDGNNHLSFWRLKFFYILVLLFKSSEESFLLVVNKESPLGIDFSKSPRTKILKEKLAQTRQAYLEEYFTIHQQKQKRVTIVSLLVSGSSIVFAVAIGIIVSLVSPIFFTNAMTYGWIQDSWTGGVTTTVATHASNQAGWTSFSTSTGTVISSTKIELIRETNGVQ